MDSGLNWEKKQKNVNLEKHQSVKFSTSSIFHSLQHDSAFIGLQENKQKQWFLSMVETCTSHYNVTLNKVIQFINPKSEETHTNKPTQHNQYF